MEACVTGFGTLGLASDKGLSDGDIPSSYNCVGEVLLKSLVRFALAFSRGDLEPDVDDGLEWHGDKLLCWNG